MPEVLSVSAGATYDLIKECYIYSCPDRYVYEKFDYITFRNKAPKKGQTHKSGEMDRLYKVVKTLTFNQLIESELDEQLSLKPEYAERLITYINSVKQLNHKHLDRLNYRARFYILSLSETNNIELKHKPRPRVNNAGGWHYTKAELMDTKKEFVETC